MADEETSRGNAFGEDFLFLFELLDQCSQLQMLDSCISIGSALCVSVWMDSPLKVSFNFQVSDRDNGKAISPLLLSPRGCI